MKRLSREMIIKPTQHHREWMVAALVFGVVTIVGTAFALIVALTARAASMI